MIMFDLDDLYIVWFGNNLIPFPNMESVHEYLDKFSNAFNFNVVDCKVFNCKKVVL